MKRTRKEIKSLAQQALALHKEYGLLSTNTQLIAQAISQGLSTRAIAEKFNIKPSKAYYYTQKIYSAVNQPVNDSLFSLLQD